MMDSEVFRAILALDAYNRGYHPGIADLPSGVGDHLGNATISQVAGDQPDQAIGFYAITYEWNGETIISYRGTGSPEIEPNQSLMGACRTGRSGPF